MRSSIGIIPLFKMKSGRDQLSRRKKENNYEVAMNQAFSEIFRNLKEIKEDTEKQRKKANLERARRDSAPAMTLKKKQALLPSNRKMNSGETYLRLVPRLC